MVGRVIELNLQELLPTTTIDYCSDPFMATIQQMSGYASTNEAISKVKEQRRHVVNQISELVAEQLMEEIESRDTYDGYRKDRLK